MLLAAGPEQSLGVGAGARLVFGEGPKREGAWAGRRLLLLDERPAFELSLWCGTCGFVFRRLEGANEKLSLENLQSQLNEGLVGLDADAIGAFATLLPLGSYIPMLIELVPQPTLPVSAGDYFAEERVTTWGVDPFWGLPENPRTPYYRTFETAVDGDTHLYEFVVPMVPPSWNEPDRVQAHRELLETSSRPTAVSVSTLDVCAPAMDTYATDYYEHWGLTHFLLDGHHKMQAAAEAGRPVQLLTLLSVDSSLATPEQVRAVPGLRKQPSAKRPSLDERDPRVSQ